MRKFSMSNLRADTEVFYVESRGQMRKFLCRISGTDAEVFYVECEGHIRKFSMSNLRDRGGNFLCRISGTDAEVLYVKSEGQKFCRLYSSPSVPESFPTS
jgi:hypothetical protein